MSTDRPLHLDVGVPSGSHWDQSHTGAQGEPHARQGLQQDSVKLQDLLAATPAAPAAATAASNAPAGGPGETPHPFDLFRPQGTPTAHTVPAAPAPARVPADASLDAMLQHMASRLLVNDGQHGRRAVHLQLEDAQLPGVELQVFEDQGRLTALFTCASENARLKLLQQSSWLAEQLAHKLQRPTCVQVQTDDPSAPCLEQVVCDAF